MGLATLATFPNTMLAHIAKDQLSNHGIEAVILHEHFHSTYAFALGEIPLMVPEQQLEQAQQILAENFEEDSP